MAVTDKDNQYASFGLQDKIAIVTGASQGIGKTLAYTLAEAGVHVALVSRTQSALEAVAEEIEALGRRALVVPTDLRNVPEIRKMVRRVHEHYGRIDILINNAAWTDTRPALEVTEEEWDQTIDTSLKGLFFAAQAVAPIMMEQGGGKIINIGSTLGKVAFAGRAVYSAAKGAVHQLTRSLAYEWAEEGISVNAMAPCVTETPTRRNLFSQESYRDWVVNEMFPVRRWAQPEDLVGATLFLCSDLSEMVVGHVLMVDGGWTIH